MADAMEVDENHRGGAMEVDNGQPRQHNPIYEYSQETANLRDEHAPYGMSRRRSMSHEEERQRRASIKAILADNSITPQERRRSIQNLMDGRRSSIGTASVTSSAGNTEENSSSYGYGDTSPYGYGDASPYGYGDADPTPRDETHQRSRGMEYGEGGGTSPDADYCMPVCNENTKRAEMTRPPCNHYERKCTLVSHCCGAAFGCRICHDDSPILPPLLIAKQAQRRYARSSSLPGSYTNMDPQTPEDTHHTIDRFKVKEVICRECYTKQSAKT
jgi:CHY zinc finger